ncbi:hypothetical protein NEOKW01_0124 [Nematocida sp. AWRm80]|nr:hypothetical protein NEOKW01_0124 [Nematocida sp. AWRm80]
MMSSTEDLGRLETDLYDDGQDRRSYSGSSTSSNPIKRLAHKVEDFFLDILTKCYFGHPVIRPIHKYFRLPNNLDNNYKISHSYLSSLEPFKKEDNNRFYYGICLLVLFIILPIITPEHSKKTDQPYNFNNSYVINRNTWIKLAIVYLFLSITAIAIGSIIYSLLTTMLVVVIQSILGSFCSYIANDVFIVIGISTSIFILANAFLIGILIVKLLRSNSTNNNNVLLFCGMTIASILIYLVYKLILDQNIFLNTLNIRNIDSIVFLVYFLVATVLSVVGILLVMGIYYSLSKTMNRIFNSKPITGIRQNWILVSLIAIVLFGLPLYLCLITGMTYVRPGFMPINI